MKKFHEKENERFSLASANIYIKLEITPKENMLDLYDEYPKFVAELSHVID